MIPFYTALDYIADLGVSSALIQHDDHTPERVSTVFWFNLLISTGLFVLLLGIGPLYAWIQSHAGDRVAVDRVRREAADPESLRDSVRAAAQGAAVRRRREGARRRASLRIRRRAWCSPTSVRAIWSFTLAAITRAFVFGVIIQLRHPFLPRFVFRPHEVVDYVKFGARTAASNVLYQVYTSLRRTDRLSLLRC